MIKAVEWKDDALVLLDQTRIPEETVYCRLTEVSDVFEAICSLMVRGAPAIGITAAYGLYLALRNFSGESPQFFAEMNRQIDYLASARPTAVNLRWALESLRQALLPHQDEPTASLKDRLFKLARALHEDDRQRCDLIGEHGQDVVPESCRILTHCNTGALATGGIGTALAVVYKAHQRGKKVHVYADETRPVLQGARLTVWELHTAGVPVDLICDNMAAALMQQGMADLVIVGADRIASDGSAANKIGTYGLAVLAKYHRIPFYVAAPLSTFDFNLKHGKDIPIEMRNNDEIRKVFNRCLITVPDVSCWNPAFDVTPPELISGIITEAGIIRAPYRENIQKVAHKQLFA